MSSFIVRPETVWACPKCHEAFKPEDRTAHESYSTCFNQSVPMEYFRLMPKPVENRTLRPWIVGYMPTRFPDKLSWIAAEIDPDLWKQGTIKGSLAMAAQPIKAIEAVSEKDAIAKVKALIGEMAKAKGKTYADYARILTRKYYGS